MSSPYPRAFERKYKKLCLKVDKLLEKDVEYKKQCNPNTNEIIKHSLRIAQLAQEIRQLMNQYGIVRK